MTVSPASTSAKSNTISYGQSAKVFIVTIANAGPSHAHGVTLTVNVPSPAMVSSTTNCSHVSGSSPYACKVADIADGASAIVYVAISLDSPVDAEGNVLSPADPAVPGTDPYKSCHPWNAGVGTEAIGTATFTVSNAVDGSTDPATGNNAGTQTLYYGEHTDLEVAMSGPETGSEGEVLTFTTTVKNKGPCTATNVWLDPWWDSGFSLETVAGGCTSFPDAGGYLECVYDNGTGTPVDLAKDASFTVTTTVKVAKMASDLKSTTITSGVDIGADQKDPVADDNSASTATFVDTGHGCSSGGAGGAMALLSLVPLALLRRRRA